MGTVTELPLPVELRALVAAFAAYDPTPSAVAIRAHLQAHPWLEDMIAAVPELHPGAIILEASWVGLDDCWECSRCVTARLHKIRRRRELAGA